MTAGETPQSTTDFEVPMTLKFRVAAAHAAEAEEILQRCLEENLDVNLEFDDADGRITAQVEVGDLTMTSYSPPGASIKIDLG